MASPGERLARYLDLVLGVPAYRWLTTGKPVGAATIRAAIDLVWQGAQRRD